MRKRLIFALLAFSALSVAAPKLETYYTTKTGHKYHRAGCRYLKKSKFEVTAAEIKRKHLEPCSVCKP